MTRDVEHAEDRRQRNRDRAGTTLPKLLSDPDAVLIVTAVMDAILALGAFVLSFDALRELAIVAGLRVELAWIWPVIVDGFIVVATINAIVLSERSSKAAWYPWAALLVFAVVSVIGNGLHAARHADTDAIRAEVAAVVSAIPAVALLVISHLIVVMLMARRQGVVEDLPPGSRGPARRRQSARIDTHPPRHEERGRVPTAITRRAPTRPRVGDRDLVAWIRAEVAGGRRINGTSVADHLRVSPATGRRRLQALRTDNPDLAQLLSR